MPGFLAERQYEFLCFLLGVSCAQVVEVDTGGHVLALGVAAVRADIVGAGGSDAFCRGDDSLAAQIVEGEFDYLCLRQGESDCRR
jgi:hypothetical protein